MLVKHLFVFLLVNASGPAIVVTLILSGKDLFGFRHISP